MTKIAVLGHSGIMRGNSQKTTQQIFAECGLNTGNMAFWYAVSRHIKNEITYVSWHTKPEVVNECSALVLVAANWIGAHSNLEQLAVMVEKATVPVVIVGLGAQAGLGAKSFAAKLQPGTLRFLDVIAERGVHVGTRGAFSAEIVSSYGVKNVEAMGCPSNFINLKRNLGETMQGKFSSINPRRIAMNFDLGGVIKPHVKSFAAWLHTHGGAFICQDPVDMIRLARMDYDIGADREMLEKVHEVVAPDLSFEDFLIFVHTYFQVFYDADSWMSYLSTCDLSVGSRLHGNVLAFHAECPAVIIPHDSRTDELSSTLKMPTVSIQEAAKCSTPQEFISAVQFDGAAYDANRKKLVQVYAGILEGAGIELSDGLLEFKNNQ